MIDIVSIGAATFDIFLKSNIFEVKQNRLLLPYSSKNEVKQTLVCSGGGATNSSVSFSRLGLKSACLSLIGSDPFSEIIINNLASEKVNSLVYQSKEDTDFSVILIAPDGGRTILTQRGPSRLESKNVKWSSLKSAGWFYITSLEGNLSLLEKIIGFARENHTKISLNPGRGELLLRRQLESFLPLVDFLLLNRVESEMLTGLEFSDSRFWPKINSWNCPLVAVTNGRDGAYILTPTKKLYSPIINTKPVDETGAGDAFGSAFVAALAHNLSPEQALEWGIKNSASVVSFIGAKPGLLTLKQIRK
ncbi:MAG: carbohydrate kinase family protein [Candidatus Shapirobacteria bacterium]|jgi:sugar/nucleoside kinase (ribokinase family)